MIIEDRIIAALEGLVDGRVCADMAEEGTERPYIVFQNVGGQPLSFIDGSAPDKEFARVQVSVWCATRSEASALGKLVEDTLRATTALRTDVLTGRAAVFDEETQLRGTRQDFRFFT